LSSFQQELDNVESQQQEYYEEDPEEESKDPVDPKMNTREMFEEMLKGF